MGQMYKSFFLLKIKQNFKEWTKIDEKSENLEEIEQILKKVQQF